VLTGLSYEREKGGIEKSLQNTTRQQHTGRQMLDAARVLPGAKRDVAWTEKKKLLSPPERLELSTS
jgi:hypothetical protein